MNAQKVCAQGSTQKWAGHKPADVASAKAGSNDALFYLYNVGTGLYLSQGGVWGTCAVVSEAGIQFQRMESKSSYVSGAYNLKTFVGSYANYMNFSNGLNLDSPGYFFLDQHNTTNGDKDFRYTSSFVFTEVSKGVYTIYATSKQGTGYTGTFYLSVNDDNTCYGKQRTGTDADGNKVANVTITDKDKWIIVTKADIINNFENTEGTTANPAYAPHLVYDAGFYREDTNVEKWAMGENRSTYFNAANYYYYTKGNNGKLTGTNTKDNSLYDNGFKPENATYTYYIGNGYNMAKKVLKEDEVFTFEDGSPVEDGGTYYQKLFGGYWTANIHGTEGSISQQITPGRKGWWKVSAKGFSNDGTGNLFAYAVTTEQQNTDKYQVQPFNKVDTEAEGIDTYVKASKYLNTTASQSVTVYVDEGETLTFGAYIKKGEGKETSWTCFDDFTLAYLGEGELNLIIDETNEDIANINGQSNTEKNQTLRLIRSFKTDKWNSLVLPVKLTAQQVKTAFGADTKLSVLDRTELDGKRIFFEKVDLSVDDADAITADNLYIIKPQNAMPTGLNEKIRKINPNGSEIEISSSTSYYTINQVSLTKSDLPEGVQTEVKESDEDHGIKMVGTYVSKTGTDVQPSIPANSYILSNGTWYYHTAGVKNVKGLRGWIQTNANPSSSGTKIFINGVEEGEVTAIEGIENSMEVSKRINSNIYNLNGQLVRSNSVSAEGLDKGIYIIGGKKVVVK